MPILTARLGELLTITGVNAATMRSDTRRGYGVAAFGTDRPTTPGRYLLIDGVAWRIRDELDRRGMKRKAAANITRTFFDQWITALSHIEHRNEPTLFAVAEQTEKIGRCGIGHADELAGYIAQQPPLRRLICVNIAEIMLDMRERATAAKLSLAGGNFFLPPDHPQFEELVADCREWRLAKLREFDPIHMRTPPRPRADLRHAIEEQTWPIPIH
jgi:hypothetical protein